MLENKVVSKDNQSFKSSVYVYKSIISHLIECDKSHQLQKYYPRDHWVQSLRDMYQIDGVWEAWNSSSNVL